MNLSDQAAIWLYSSICVACSLVALYRCRRIRDSLGFPVAYLLLIMIIHLPGGLALPYNPIGFSGSRFVLDYTREGLFITAIGCVAFLIGLLIGELKALGEQIPVPAGEHAQLRQFARFCVVGGWAAFFMFTPLRDVPSLGAAIYFGSALWMLGVILGLYNALRIRNLRKIVFWCCALAMCPSMIMILGGFLSFGTATVVIVLSGVLVRISRPAVLVPAAVVAAFLGLNLFVNYFLVRDSLREVLWSDANFSQRLDAIEDTAGDLSWIDSQNPAHMEALAIRLNQSEFLGLAAYRLEQGQVQSLRGGSILEALLSLVPRAFWPGKPVSGGSGDLVVHFTGLNLSENASWGVGNVMEFYINGGLIGVIIGFVVLGFLIRWLDIRCYMWLVSKEPQQSILYFLPAAALIQPGMSLSEMVGGAVAGWVAAIAWVFFWNHLLRPRSARISA